MIIYLFWENLIPFVVTNTMLVSDVFARMAEKIKCEVTTESHRLVIRDQVKTPLPFDKTLEELNIRPKTELICMSY